MVDVAGTAGALPLDEPELDSPALTKRGALGKSSYPFETGYAG